jgi:DNA-binding beta-propeller fold protein YncE
LASTPSEPTEPTAETAPAIEVGGGPVGVTADGDAAVWVVSSRGEQVSRIPSGATDPDLVVDVPGVPLRAVAADDAVWVSSFRGEQLLRIDAATGTITDTINTGAGPEGLASGFGSIWLVEQDAGNLVRIDPTTRTIVSRTDIGTARLPHVGSKAVYVAAFVDDRVLRIDPSTLVVQRSKKVCSGPQGMTEAAGRLWVACTFSDEVVALDPVTLERTSRIPVEGLPDSIVAQGGRLLVVAEEGPRLVIIDPASGEVTEEILLGEETALYDSANLDLAVSGGEAWVTSFKADRVYHVPLP